VPPREWRLRIEDILEAIAKIQRFTAGMDWQDFEQDERTIAGVLYEFVIIGEATRHVPAEIVGRYPELPWNEMRGMRNFVAHAYHGVKLKTIWETVLGDIPTLAPLLERILEGTSSNH
jgi:uncharacterized protein with HEPN domain